MKADAGLQTQIESRIAATVDLIYDREGGNPDLIAELRYLELARELATTSPDDAAAMYSYLH